MIEMIRGIFEKHANDSRATEMSRYLRNLFPFYGISRPQRALMTKPIMQELKTSAPDRELIHSLWNQPQREYQYFCMDYMEATKKHWNEEIILDFERFIISKSWWDTVDFLAIRLAGEYFLKWPEKKEAFAERWSKSDNFWLNRTAILFQLKYRGKTDIALLHRIIKKHRESDEFFIQKAIGWALRQYSYTDSESVREFISSVKLKPLSKREAIKRMKFPE